MPSSHCQPSATRRVTTCGLAMLAALAGWFAPPPGAGEPPQEPSPERAQAALERASAAYRSRQFDAALEAADEALAADATLVQAQWVRGQAAEALRQFETAVDAYSAYLAARPDAAEVCQRRGIAQFRLGRIDESIADFDRFVELRPAEGPGHWMRGISYYYAERFEDGQQQFEGYQTVDANDVENVVWRALCMARRLDPETARRELLAVGPDPRIPMQQIYELFAGRAAPEDVLAAARAGTPTPEQLAQRMFYAHLYLGLWHESQGNAPQCLAEIRTAVEKYPVGGYMWEVARVHLQLRREPETK